MPRSRKTKPQEAPSTDQLGLFPQSASVLASKTAEPPAPQQSGPTIYTVAQITGLIEGVLDRDPVLGGLVTVRGELSNVKQSSRGHVYFTLRDEHAGINGILWASQFIRLPFDLEDGLEVYLTGKLEIYAPSGTYSLVTKKLEPVGLGPLQLAFQQIKARLEAEGLFLEEYKKEIPDFPERIGIVTSRTGAVIHDMLRVIRRKNPLAGVLLLPVKVQGEGAADEIAAAIRELNHPSYGIDIMIVGRGGGSFEDLFCFSEEAVVRAVFESRVPIITGIGHEPDYSLADAAADFSCSTPTAAAEHAVPDACALMEHVAYQSAMLMESMSDLILESEQTLDYHATRLLEQHQFLLEGVSNKLTRIQERLLSQGQMAFQRFAQETAARAGELHAFSPLATLSRGYAIATDDRGDIIKSIRQVKVGDTLTVSVPDGELPCQVINPPIQRPI